MPLATTFNSVLLALHLLSAFALAGSIVLFSYLIVRSRNVDTPGPTIAHGPRSRCGEKVVIVGGIGTLVFGIWLAIRLDHVQVWSGWVIAAIVLWIVATATGQRSGVEFERAMTKAEELEAAGQTGAERGAPRPQPAARGLISPRDRDDHRLPDPDRHDLEAGSQRLVGVPARQLELPAPDPHHRRDDPRRRRAGRRRGARACCAATCGKLKLGYYSLLFVAFPGLILTKIGATAIWSKESAHSFIGAAFPHTDDPRWIMIGGTALDGGAGLLVLALILGWFGLRRMDGGESDFLTRSRSSRT